MELANKFELLSQKLDMEVAINCIFVEADVRKAFLLQSNNDTIKSKLDFIKEIFPNFMSILVSTSKNPNYPWYLITKRETKITLNPLCYTQYDMGIQLDYPFAGEVGGDYTFEVMMTYKNETNEIFVNSCDNISHVKVQPLIDKFQTLISQMNPYLKDKIVIYYHFEENDMKVKYKDTLRCITYT